jgi:TonB family protein
MPVGIPPFGLPQRKAANEYGAYAEGVVYLIVYFANPKHDEKLEFFLEKQLKVRELRNAEIGTANETSADGRRVLNYEFKSFDFRKKDYYPGALKLVDDKDRAFALIAIGKESTDASIAQFLKSLEIADKPAGVDVGAGGTNASDVNESASVVSSSTVSRKLMIIVKPEPSYTEDARRKKLRGSVTLKAVLAASGKVTNIEIVSGVQDFYAPSIAAAGKVCFIPAVKDGRFVSTWVEMVYNFNIY